MMAVDTNILVRFLTRDDPAQAEIVRRRFKQAETGRETLWVPLLVVLELIWVLESAYGKSRGNILDALEDLRRLRVLQFENDDALEALIADGRSTRADLADLLLAHSAVRNGAEAVLTLDREAARHPRFRRLN